MSQVGTFLAYANGSVRTGVDGELYLPRHGFAPEMADLRKKKKSESLLNVSLRRKYNSVACRHAAAAANACRSPSTCSQKSGQSNSVA